MKYQELYKKAKALAELAAAAAEANDMVQYEKHLTEAKAIRAQADAMKAAAEEMSTYDSPVPPAALPVDDDVPNSTMPSAAPAKPEETPEQRMNKAVYTLRYGDDTSSVRAVLTDMHGPNYEAKRLAQYSAFVKYLRQYTREPVGEERDLLRELILTPEYAAKAIESGQDIKFLKATMVEAIDDLGGYVVPVDFQLNIIRRLRGLTVMRGRAQTMTTSRDRVDIPKMTGGDDQYTTAVRVTWVSETPTAGTADTNLTLGMESIPVHDVMAETFLSRNVVEDSAVDLVGELTTAFAEAAAMDEDNQFLTGDGVGKPQGILIGATTPVAGVTSVVSGAAAAITADGLIDLEYEIPSQYRPRAVYITARRTVRDMRKLKGGDGHYLWGNADVAGQPGTFDGFPVLEQEVMPAVAASAYPILFGDPSGYRIVDRIGMTVERYLDSQTARQNLILYIMRRRLGGQLTHPERWAVQQIAAS